MKLATRLGLTAAATTASLLAAPAAIADQRVFLDETGDAPGHIDLTRVKVDNGSSQPRYVKVRLTLDRKIKPGDGLWVYYDTDRSDAGPEYRLSGVANSEYEFYKVPGWTRAGHPQACDDYRMKQVQHDERQVRTAILRSCLRGPDRIRMSVRTDDVDGTGMDWAPARRQLLPFVPR
ncbi:MAG: hypothetical protein ACR2FP_02815 [Nocardioidaceae bacterium]